MIPSKFDIMRKRRELLEQKRRDLAEKPSPGKVTYYLNDPLIKPSKDHTQVIRC